MTTPTLKIISPDDFLHWALEQLRAGATLRAEDPEDFVLERLEGGGFVADGLKVEFPKDKTK